MSKHAEVRIGEYTVPLIGINEEAVLEVCDLCGDYTYLGDVTYNGTHFLCKKCSTSMNPMDCTMRSSGSKGM